MTWQYLRQTPGPAPSSRRRLAIFRGESAPARGRPITPSRNIAGSPGDVNWGDGPSISAGPSRGPFGRDESASAATQELAPFGGALGEQPVRVVRCRRRAHLVKARSLLIAQFNVRRHEVVPELCGRAGAEQRGGNRGAVGQPAESDSSGGHAELRCDRLHGVDDPPGAL